MRTIYAATVVSLALLGIAGCSNTSSAKPNTASHAEPTAEPVAAQPAVKTPSAAVESPVSETAVAAATPAVVETPPAVAPAATTPATPVESPPVTRPVPAAPVSETRVRTPIARRPTKSTDGVIDITFDTIKFEMQDKEQPFERKLITPEIEALNGKTVRVRGYILPSFQQRGLTQLVLMRDNQECCFGPGAWIYDCIIVDMKPGKSADFSVRPVTVDGTFEVRPLDDGDGKTLAVYHIDGEEVK